MTKKEITPEYMAEVAMYAIVSSRCYVQTAEKYGVTVSDITFWVNIMKRNAASLYSEENLKSESGMQTKAISDSEMEVRRRYKVLNDRRKANTSHVPKITKERMSAYYFPKMEMESAWVVENTYDFCFILRQKERWIKGATKLMATNPENSFYICTNLLRSLPLLWNREDIQPFFKTKRIANVITEADKLIQYSLGVMDNCQAEYNIAIDVYKSIKQDLVFQSYKEFQLSDID
ncbi:MAG: hypothetical protein ACRCX4_00255 [Bacteroidales bacterium]